MYSFLCSDNELRSKVLICAVLVFFSTYYCVAQPLRTEPLIIDHTSAPKFNNIPDSILSTVSSIKLMFRHASVGSTINNGLNCIQGTRTNPAECKLFPAYKYDRRNWVFEPRGNSGWYGKITDFVTEVNRQIDTYDIFSFKYCYLEGLDQVAEPCGGANFNPSLVKKAWDSLRINMEKLETKYPEKIFIWWTIPLTQPGQHCTDTLNYLMRNYVLQNNKILFDIADIQCWDSLNQHLTNSNGWEMAFSGYCGEKPPGPSCHPNWTGSIILGKAFWWMMSSIAGAIDTNTHDTIPSLTTAAIASITKNSAISGGNISSDGGLNVTSRGVIWDTLPGPGIHLTTKTADGTGSGIFTSNITGLSQNTTYYVRAYAANALGTAYGNELSFTTNLTNINESEIHDISVYPNPASSTFSLKVPSSATFIHIYSASGKELYYNPTEHKTLINFEKFDNGIYYIHVTTHTQTIIRKIIILN